MKIYNYNSMSGEYISQTDAVESPEEEGKFLIPAGATTVSPPTITANKAAVWNGEGWDLVADYRGQAFYSTEDGQPIALNLGDEPDEATAIPKTDSNAVWTGTKWQIPIAVLIERKRTEITNERNEKITSTTVLFKGHDFDADRVTQNNLSNTLMAINAGIYTEASISWRTADDQDIELTTAELPALGALMLNAMHTLYGISWALKDQLPPISLMEDYDEAIEALEALVWP